MHSGIHSTQRQIQSWQMQCNDLFSFELIRMHMNMCTIILSVSPPAHCTHSECVTLKVRSYSLFIHSNSSTIVFVVVVVTVLFFLFLFVLCAIAMHSFFSPRFPLRSLSFLLFICWSFVFFMFFILFFPQTNQLDQHAIVIKLQCNRTNFQLTEFEYVFRFFFASFGDKAAIFDRKIFIFILILS